MGKNSKIGNNFNEIKCADFLYWHQKSMRKRIWKRHLSLFRKALCTEILRLLHEQHFIFKFKLYWNTFFLSFKGAAFLFTSQNTGQYSLNFSSEYIVYKFIHWMLQFLIFKRLQIPSTIFTNGMPMLGFLVFLSFYP